MWRWPSVPRRLFTSNGQRWRIASMGSGDSGEGRWKLRPAGRAQSAISRPCIGGSRSRQLVWVLARCIGGVGVVIGRERIVYCVVRWDTARGTSQ